MLSKEKHSKEKSKQKIDFLIAGTQKGGTTALDNIFRKHPEIGMAKRKEIHFFDDENVYSKSQKVNYKNYLIDKFRNDILQVEDLLGWNCQDWLI